MLSTSPTALMFSTSASPPFNTPPQLRALVLDPQQQMAARTAVPLAVEVHPPKGVGLVYEAPPPTFLSDLVAYVTLTGLFSFVLLAPLLAIAWGYWIYAGSWIGSALLAVLLSSPFWAFGVSEAVRNSRVFQSWRTFFHYRVWKEERMPDDQRNVLFAMFPHGMFPMSLACAAGIAGEIFPEWGDKASERFSSAVASVFFKAPLLAPLLTWLGCHPCDAACLRKLVRRGSCVLVPEGIAGVFHSHREREMVYVQKRKGFIRLAIQEGATLVPVYAFGQTQLHDVAFGPDGIAARVSRYLRIALVIFTGQWGILPLPRREPLLMAIGKPLLLPKCDNPTEEEVDATHALFIERLVSLFERNKHLVGWEKKELIIV